MCRIFLFVFLALKYQSEAFNFSPYPNLVINFPKHLKTHLNQTRSSYFGYSLVIRPTSIIVGAPRAQSDLESQRTINETGAIYRCSLSSGSCTPYVLDPRGNFNASDQGVTWDSDRKDFQWLGGSMDGGTRDTDKLLVCAPRFYTPTPNNYLLHGVCLWVQNTVAEAPENVTRISPFRLKSKQVNSNTNAQQVKKQNYFYYAGELGHSAHVAEDSNSSKFLIGAPGVRNWKGSVIFYQQDAQIFEPWRQRDNTYFGYAVSSGYFDSANPSTLLYVASAPRANHLSGEAYIFDFRGRIIRTLRRLRGKQFGEYFGYSLLAEDLNGDGKTDLIVSAPLHAFEHSYDTGAIYVFINNGLFNSEPTIVRPPLGSKARFGTTLSRLGDINKDGYNDVAVGAPFAGNGSVFIYLGSAHGLRDQPSQRLDAPNEQPSQYGAHMFGHGLSRGSDIDGNGFNDFAIGAPNAEALYFYRAYPVVKIHATIKSESREIKSEQEVVKITACYRLSTSAEAKDVEQQELDIRISIETQLKWVKFARTQSNRMILKVNAGLEESCQHFDINVRYGGEMYTSIDLQMHYELAKKVPVSGEFCKTCAVVDPADSKVSTERITISTDCVSDVCVADLQIRSKNVRPTYVLGSDVSLHLDYEITNNGETAYLPQFNVSSTPQLPFAQVPGNCKVSNAVMVCDLNRGGPLAKGDSDSVTISFDVSQLSGESLTIHAEVFSAGNERSLTDNKQTNVIGLKEFTEIDASGGQTNGQIVLKHFPYSAEIINHYEIKSRGPSVIEQLTLSFYIPVAYKAFDSTAIIPIINKSSLDIQATYDSRLWPIKLYDQKGFSMENSTQSEQDYDPITTRQRRDLNGLTSDQEQINLPVDRTIVFNCQDTNMTICLRADLSVQFRPDKPISLNISFNVDLSEVKRAEEYFVILTDLQLLKKGDPASSTFVINRKFKPNVIFKHQEPELPVWNIILALIGGLLLLSVITYALYKLGFFKRTKRDELHRLIRQSYRQEVPVELDADSLCSE
ncbi:LOW QUALITY PROTEIN: integrin alpha-PS3-like [Drosophila gunungcola]|uniref:LOW QUALITY PROTEIN: integrin alpha-PS3-like n=1 Tax=Drosophila gunungcola TaxID=103775 RepID=UPI0022E5BDE4|nr:LOW QUALITY PROTEIN: integrin alpha-PS3-like [Drosophila gunungcola]